MYDHYIGDNLSVTVYGFCFFVFLVVITICAILSSIPVSENDVYGTLNITYYYIQFSY